MSKVIVKCSSYEYPLLRRDVFELMDALGGREINKNARVIIKPNLLAPSAPEKAVVTHPLVIKATAEYVLSRGAHPRISDSPSIRSFKKVIEESGIKDALSGLDVTFREFDESIKFEIGEPFGKIDISKDALNADFIINLPKLKTHVQMFLTLAVKNLFGCIVGMKKPEWHLRTGVDRKMFARLLVSIYRAVRPQITIIDGILGMEGEGPGKSGTPRHVGVLLGGNDCIALDLTVCRMLGIDSNRVLTNMAAEEMGLSPGHIEIEGILPLIMDFKFPEIIPILFGPKSLHGFMRKHLVQRPVRNDDMCRMCGECWKYCPAKAITPEKSSLHFDYDKCIRCYCCIEVCPLGALHAKETVQGKVYRKVLKIK